MKPKLLDLFCGAGGASMGYHRAGFEVIGADNKPQPHYPFPFIIGDALEIVDMLLAGNQIKAHGRGFHEWYGLNDLAAFHASPPCQRYSAITKQHGKEVVEKHLDLILPTRNMLAATGKPYIIENVPGAKKELINPYMLCGTMFDLRSGEYLLRRHRYFECSFDIYFAPASCYHAGLPLSVYGHPGGSSCRDHVKMGYSRDWRIGMDIDWMTNDELAQAIPPAYTEYIGKYLMQAVMRLDI